MVLTVDLVSNLRGREGGRKRMKKRLMKGKGKGERGRGGKEGGFPTHYHEVLLVCTVFFFRIISFMRASSTLSRSSCNCLCCSRMVSMVTTYTADGSKASYTQ